MRGSWITAAALLLAPSAIAGDVVTLKLGTDAPEGSPWLDGLQQLARIVERNSKGEVRVRVFPAGVLGDEREVMAGLARGTVDGYGGSVAATSEQLPELSAFELPFLFDTDGEVDATFARTRPIIEQITMAHGYRYVTWSAIGFRHLGTKRPVNRLDDLRSMRLRSQPSPVHERMWTLLGVRHVALGIPAVANALDDGTVDGFDNAVVSMFAFSWHTHIRHLTLTRHIYQPGILVFGPSAMKRVPGRLQATLFEGAESAVQIPNVRRVREVERALLESLPQLNVSVHAVSGELRGELERATRPGRAEWRKRAGRRGQQLLEAIERSLALHREGRTR